MNNDIGVLIYTYNRVHDARINMEIIRNVWERHELFKNVTIVHAFNGEESWWKDAYLEDTLIRTSNPGHSEGADLLISSGIEAFRAHYPHIRHVVVLAADTWCVRPDYIEMTIKEMQRDSKFLATCAWGNEKNTDMFYAGMALDFFVVDVEWSTAHGLFPIRYREFLDAYIEVFLYQDAAVYLEKVFALRFKQAIMHHLNTPIECLTHETLEQHIYRLVEREPVHYDETNLLRKMYWKVIGLITHHDPKHKRIALREWKLPLGIEGKRFLAVNDLVYYNNNGLRRMTQSLYGSSE